MIRLKLFHKHVLQLRNKAYSHNLVNHRSLLNDLLVCRWNIDLTDYPELNCQDKVNEAKRIYLQFQRSVKEQEIKKDIENKSSQANCHTMLIGNGLRGMQRCKVAELLGGGRSSNNDNVIHHTVLTEAIEIWANDNQRNRFLQHLISGAIQGIYADSHGLVEPAVPPLSSTTATLSNGGTHYSINGLKSNVPYIDKQCLILGIANIDDGPQIEENSFAFLVDTNTPGVSFNVDSQKNKDHRNCDVRFINVAVPRENVLGSIGWGHKVMRRAKMSQSVLLSSIYCGKQKSLLEQCTRFANEREVFGVSLFEYEKVKSQLVNVCIDAFLSESMVYFLAGYLEVDDGRDWLTESLVTQVFCEEAVSRSSGELLALLGHNGLKEGSFVEDYHDATRPESRCVSYRQMVARDCLRHFLTHYSEMEHSWAQELGCKLGVVPEVRCFSSDRSESIARHLFPSMAILAQGLFVLVRRMSLSMNEARQTRGQSLLSDTQFLSTLSDWMLDLWPIMTAISRVSRAFCLRLPTREHQVNLLATHFIKVHSRLDRDLPAHPAPVLPSLDLLQLARANSTAHNGLAHPIDL